MMVCSYISLFGSGMMSCRTQLRRDAVASMGYAQPGHLIRGAMAGIKNSASTLLGDRRGCPDSRRAALAMTESAFGAEVPATYITLQPVIASPGGSSGARQSPDMKGGEQVEADRNKKAITYKNCHCGNPLLKKMTYVPAGDRRVPKKPGLAMTASGFRAPLHIHDNSNR